MYTVILLALLPGQTLTNEQIRVERERALRDLLDKSEAGRPFVEEYGAAAEDCVKSLWADKDVAFRLAESHRDGRLAALPDPAAFLRCVTARPRLVVDWALRPESLWALADPEAFAAFLEGPVPYAAGRRKLSDGAAALRARRQAEAAHAARRAKADLLAARPAWLAPPPESPAAQEWRRKLELLATPEGMAAAGAVVLVVLWGWRRYRREW